MRADLMQTRTQNAYQPTLGGWQAGQPCAPSEGLGRVSAALDARSLGHPNTACVNRAAPAAAAISSVLLHVCDSALARGCHASATDI